MNFKAAIRRNETNSSGKVNIKIRVSHQRKTRYISTDFYIDPEIFDDNSGRIDLNKYPSGKLINLKLKKKEIEFEETAIKLNESIDIKTLMDILKGNENPNADFFEFTEKHVSKLTSENKIKTAEVYRYTLNTVKEFYAGPLLDFKLINFKLLSEFETYLTVKGLGVNAIGVHMRNIRSMFNRAIDEGVAELSHYPFRRFKIKKQKTEKRSLSTEQMRLIKHADLTGVEEYIRDMFLLIFYFIGINAKDLCYLTKQNIKQGRLVYRRAKTGRIYNILVLPQAQEILNKYPGQKYLLNCLDRYYSHKQFIKSISKFLRRVCMRFEIDEPVTSYYARHSWATIASDLEISKDTISHALGHGNDTVTDIYIDFDLKKVDEANRKVIESIQ